MACLFGRGRRLSLKERGLVNFGQVRSPNVVIRAKYQEKAATIPRDVDYDRAVDRLASAFGLQSIPASQIEIHSKPPGHDSEVKVTACLWPHFSLVLDNLSVTVSKADEEKPGPFEVSCEGSNGHVIVITASSEDTVEMIKHKIQAKNDVPSDHQHLMLYHTVLENKRTLSDYGVDSRLSLYVLYASIPQDIGQNIVCLLMNNFHAFLIPYDPSTSVKTMKTMIHDKEGYSGFEQILYFRRLMKDRKTLGSYGIQPRAVIRLYQKTYLKKPVIYLFPPTPISDVRLRLSLFNSWEFATLYPQTPVCQMIDGCQSVAWTLDVKPDGTLFDHGSCREVSYLFWEGQSKSICPPSPPISRPTTPISDCPRFNPANPTLTPSGSVLLPFDKVSIYLDDALLALGLHTEARCSFITYWLPDFRQHQSVALCFLPQAEYETAVPLDITPIPDVTTRVFMLFRGVDEDELEEWAEARWKANQDPCFWRDVVGVDLNKVRDVRLFRVLEWGGMEVY